MSYVYFRVAVFVAIISAGYLFLHIFIGQISNKETPYQSNQRNIMTAGLTHKQPHIVFILADDLGFNDVSYNGKLHGSAVQTPNIDKLASEGVTLANYYVQPVCTPTRASLMTGRYPIRYGLQHEVIHHTEPYCLPADEVTLAEKLKDVGYATHAVGKWHLGYYKKECLPTRRGFDTYFGLYTGSTDHFNYSASKAYNDGSTGTGYDLHRDTTRRFTSVWKRHQGQYSTELFSKEAQKLIRRHHSHARTKQPLFLYLPFTAVHEPIQAPEHYTHYYEHVIQQNGTRRTMAGMVSCLDEAIGNIIHTLKETGLYDNTIVIFSSDNGGMGGGVLSPGGTDGSNNWPLRGGKRTLFEGGIRSIGFINSPLFSDSVKGTTSHALIHVSDWFPTILSSLAGASVSGMKQLDGFDVWHAIVSNVSSPRREILHNIDPLPHEDWNVPATTPGEAALRMGDWKLLIGQQVFGHFVTWYPPPESNFTSTEPVEPLGKKIWLFNIARDPSEKYDLPDERPGIVKRMLERLQEYNETMVPPLNPRPDPNSNPALHGGVWEPWQ